MTPHQALALGVRLFVIWVALVTLREMIAFFGVWSSPDSYDVLWVVVGGAVVTACILIALWRFPNSIARGLLPSPADGSTPASSYQMWFVLGTSLLGLWFVASSIAPILRNLSVMYFFQPELVNTEDVRSLRVGIFYFVVELAVGLCLLFGATGIRKLIWRIRDAGPD